MLIKGPAGIIAAQSGAAAPPVGGPVIRQFLGHWNKSGFVQTFQIPFAITAGSALVLALVFRGSNTVNAVSDNVNGAWTINLSGVTAKPGLVASFLGSAAAAANGITITVESSTSQASHGGVWELGPATFNTAGENRDAVATGTPTHAATPITAADVTAVSAMRFDSQSSNPAATPGWTHRSLDSSSDRWTWVQDVEDTSLVSNSIQITTSSSQLSGGVVGVFAGA